MDDIYTKDELELAFDLGGAGNLIRRYVELAGLVEVQSQNFKNTYFNFRLGAKKLDIVLPDKPAEDTTDTEKNQFYRDQLAYVEQYIFEHRAKIFHASYLAGNCFQDLYVLLLACVSASNSQEALHEKVLEKLPKLLQDLQWHAECMGVLDISEELSKIDESIDEEGIKTFARKLRMKLFRGKAEPNLAKRSEVDPSRMITDDYWVISLVRLPDTDYSQHAFLVLEGKKRSKSKIWFADFVAKNQSDLLRPGTTDGKVRMYTYESDGAAGETSELLYRCRRNTMEGQRGMMQIERNDRLLYSTWPIHVSTATALVENIQTQQNNPPKYNVFGDTYLAGSTGDVLGENTGHNCFTFARKMLLNLNDKHITIPQDKLGKWILSATSRNLPDKMLDKSWWDGVRFMLSLFAIMGLGVVVIAYLYS